MRAADPFKKNQQDTQLRQYIEAIPSFSPKQIEEKIRQYNYVGQEAALKAAALMAYRHLLRLKGLYLKGINPNQLPPKTNMLFVGPTGCGKTFLIEILFQNILRLPTVIVDMTTYSETGYVGQDVSSILTRLLYAADLNPLTAAIGVVCLDEFDKIASGQNSAVFAGAGTTKDVSGLGVQRELLKMLESADITVPIELSHSDYAPRTVISTRNIPFIACGAFSGLKGLIERKGEYIGFRRSGLSGGQDRIAVSYSIDEVEMSSNFLRYGILPELIGRFNRVVPFHALDDTDLASILRRSILDKYRNEFELQGIELTVDGEVLNLIIKESLKKETGARGIEAALIRHLENAAFEAYSEAHISSIRLYLKEGDVDFRLE